MTDDELKRLLRLLAKKQGFAPLTPEEAQRAYDLAPDVPLTQERIDEIVRFATGSHEPFGPWPKDEGRTP